MLNGTRVAWFAGLLLAFLTGCGGSSGGGSTPASAGVLRGTVESNRTGLGNYQVSLYAALIGTQGSGPDWQLIGNASTDASGAFEIHYSPPAVQKGQPNPILFVEAVSGPAMLASAIGELPSVPPSVVVNERTTVATGNAFAQFINSSAIEGNTVGMSNAVHMAANLADPITGNVAKVLALVPNGSETSTLATFNSLTNAIASCVAVASNCSTLFQATTPPGGSAPANVLQAVANLVKYPSYVQADGALAPDDPIFDLSQQRQVYSPFLTARPTSWLLFLKITGGFYSAQTASNLMNGPGNFAIDESGSVWVDDNYMPEPPQHFACAGRRVIRFTPWGTIFPGSPYFGGGLSGSGWGIGFDPGGDLWVGNFGFQDPPCADTRLAANSNSVSLFDSNGKAISPKGGYTNGSISWPQGALSDRSGNIWIANCGNDSVTEFPNGDPAQALNVPLGPPPSPGEPQIKPFGIVIDLVGNVWVTDNRNNTVSIISPDGKLIDTLPGTYQGQTVLTHPVGNAVDSQGNIWVANSDWLDVPCPTKNNVGAAANPSITLYQAGTRTPYQGSPFTGGGLTIPWGLSTDGNDTVWVFNFGVVPVGQRSTIPTGISRFCGVNTKACPPGLAVGAPISPNTGYQSNAFVRITGGQFDPSGNIWLTGNWKIDANPDMNPGGNSVVIAIGAAAPIKTPLIGPPVPFN